MRTIVKLGAIAVAAAIGLGTASAVAQDKKVRIQMQSNFASTLALLGPNAKYTVDQINKLSGGSIEMKFFEPGSLVPPGQAFDAVASGALDAAWATPGFWTGKDIAFAVYSTVPFGPGIPEYLAWMKEGGGEKGMQALYAKFGIHSIMCHLIPPEASGWFRKEIKTLDDMKGLKMRFFGLGANVMQKLGVSTQLLQAGEIFQALQLGTIDATEFSMPVMDLSLGFHQVAKFYYFPGWHQQATVGDLIINKAKWDSLSATQKAQVEAACDQTVLKGISIGESVQGPALKDIEGKGVKLMTWSPEFLAAFEKEWKVVAAEQSEKSPEFKKAWDSLSKFRTEYSAWRDRGYLK
ncbi:TRAP transporter substrate-binding protein [Bradyrhizobium icense]|uniref:C4-dicarboxylate ABC transporter n=1 Tax=Bradyrhizobium icense TaxID=1274631 RepID=A0A1B1UH95_9BRAD|nr:TRAP transporter substrate-binding protein [Bradyrhizobium icense]ANW02130.1 C4-dicarboxylate ABC transporter [Bradyrhizobium icense]